MPPLFVAQFHLVDGRIIKTIILETEDCNPRNTRDFIEDEAQFECVPLEDQIHGIMNPIQIYGSEVALMATKRISQQEFLEIMVSQKGRI